VMNVLKQDGLDVAIGNAVGKGTPYIGICVGMQILFDESEESPNAAGLGLVSGKVVKFVADKVPQIGWNEIEPQQAGFERGFVYFVNSYFAQPEQKSTVLYSSEYGGNFCAAVQKDNIIGFQFHPEKSGAFGNELLKRTIVNACRN
jgi:imidazole glycerol-phosphate synthase subunit HisH